MKEYDLPKSLQTALNRLSEFNMKTERNQETQWKVQGIALKNSKNVESKRNQQKILTKTAKRVEMPR